MILSTYASDEDYYQWELVQSGNPAGNISIVDLSPYFSGYKGSFVLYDMEEDAWTVYDMEHSLLRIPPLPEARLMKSPYPSCRRQI